MEALISRFVEFGELIVGDTIEIDVANGGEDSKVFAASFVGTPC